MIKCGTLDELKNIKWVENTHIVVGLGPYNRHAFFVVMSSHGRQTAQFANGTFNYFAVTGVMGDHGKRIIFHGGTIIPVFPDGDLLMIVEQRAPLLLRDPLVERTLEFSDGRVPFNLGLCGSPEFPAGSIENNESIVSGTLRELVEETGIEGCKARCVRRAYPSFPQIAEFAPCTHEMVVYLPERVEYPDFMDNDGGLSVLRVTREDFLFNKRRGVLNATHPVLEGWRFLHDVEDSAEFKAMLRAGEVVEDFVSLPSTT